MMSGLTYFRSVPSIITLMLACLLTLGAGPADARSAKAPAAAQPAGEQFVDGIAAVVNKQVITLRQVEEKMVQVRRQMTQQNIPVPDDLALRHQVLQQMINTELQRQEAEALGIRVSEAQLAHAIDTVAQRNRMGVDQLRREIEASGMSWDSYRTELREQVLQDILRQRLVEERINISNSDIDAFLSTNPQIAAPAAPTPRAPEPPQQPAAPTGPELVELAQILIEVPDLASNEVVAQKRAEAESLLKAVRSGKDFAGVAAASSDGPQALQGGDMGIRPLSDWPDLFIQAVKALPPGEITGILQSGRGFHILKVLRRGYAQKPGAKARPASPPPAAAQPARAPVAQPSGPMMVTQTHARHILIKTNKVMADDQARDLLLKLRRRIENGESFAELARRYSEDATAPQGGDLGWLSPGDTVPAFEQAMDALQVGQVSEPVKSPFGWHLIQVEERRTKNMEKEYRRMQARRELMQRRIGPAYEDWIDQLRGKAYIDNRLDKSTPMPN